MRITALFLNPSKYNKYMDTAHIKTLARRGAEYFKDADLLLHGFSIDCITVVFKRGLMLVWDFDEKNGKCKEGIFLIPETSQSMLKKMIFHCGEDKINKRLKNTISII